MSIRGRGKHNVIIQPRKVERWHGEVVYVDDGPPKLLKRCDVQSVREWASAEEYYEHGLSLLSLRRVFSRVWFGDKNAHVYFDGGLYEVVGDPQEFPRTRRTNHILTTIKWLGAADPPVLQEEGGVDG